MKLKKRDKFIMGGILLVAITKLPTLQQQTFDVSGLIGLIIMGAIVGLIGYVMFGRERKKREDKK